MVKDREKKKKLHPETGTLEKLDITSVKKNKLK